MSGWYTTPFQTVGDAAAQRLKFFVQRSLPVFASTTKKRPFCWGTKTLPYATTGGYSR
jgi:hypothetical protein